MVTIIKRNLAIKVSLVSVIILSWFSSYGQQIKRTKYSGEKDKKPNIIFILTDDMGWGDLGIFYQNKQKEANKPFERSPYIDKLAKQGAQLRDHYDAAPVCAPSRASILLGQSQGHANIRNNQFDKALEDNYTMANVLKKLGYDTSIFGKWGLQGASQYGRSNGTNWPANPLNRGFDYFLGYMRHTDGHEHYPKEGLYRGKKQVWLNHTDITPKLDKSYTADLWTAGAKNWIKEHEQSENESNPFFLYLAYETPHAAMELPTQAYPKGKGVEGGLQWVGEPHHMINTASGDVDSWVHPDYANATYNDEGESSTYPDVFKRYATSNRRIDSGIGDIIQLLKDLQIAENTLVVFTSDNGPTRVSMLNDPQRKVNKNKTFDAMNPSFFKSFGPFDGIKRDVLEGGERVPTIAWWPGNIPSGQIIKSPSISYDWLNTFTDAAGVAGLEVSDGVSLLPELTGEGEREESLIYTEYYEGGKTPDYEAFAPQNRGRERKQMQMMRIGNHVGIRYNIKGHSDDFEIYNILKDQKQTKNLGNVDKYPNTSALASSLQSKMKDKSLQVRRPNKSAPRPYDDELVPAVQEGNTTSGIKWKIYKGKFPWIPNIYQLDADKVGEASRPKLDMVNDENNEVVLYQGYLNIPQSGSYTFHLKTEEAAVFRIHEATIIDADYNYWGGVEKQGTIKLEKGLHPFRLYYQRMPKLVAPLLNFEWETPELDNKKTIPAKTFRRKNKQ